MFSREVFYVERAILLSEGFVWRKHTHHTQVRNKNKTKKDGKENNSRKKGRKNQNPRFCKGAAARANNRDSWDEVMCYKSPFELPVPALGRPVSTPTRSRTTTHYWRAESPSGGHHLVFDVSLLTDCPAFLLVRGARGAPNCNLLVTDWSQRGRGMRKNLLSRGKRPEDWTRVRY